MDLKTAKKHKKMFENELYYEPNSKGVMKVRETVSVRDRLMYSTIISDLTKYIKENENVKVISAPISRASRMIEIEKNITPKNLIYKNKKHYNRKISKIEVLFCN